MAFVVGFRSMMPWGCGFFTPRGIDKCSRHIFPVLAVARLGYLLVQVQHHMSVGRYGGPANSVAFQMLFTPLMLISIMSFISGLTWLVWENRWCCFEDAKRPDEVSDVEMS